ncbi:hypothetical protein DFJ73DRAFT_297922 [Zopfochytrium polystomum]|nr:hypothetical protein DFJ73DRAFT_297922 [Zopfochytrium polystomum]
MRDKKSSLRQQVTPLLGSPAASQHQAEKARGPLTLCHHCKKKASEHETVTIGPTRAFCKTCFVCEECQKTLEPGRFVEMASGLYCREHDGSSYLAYGTDASTTTPNEDPQWKGRLSVSQSYDSVLCEASTSVCSFAMVPEAVGGSSGGVGGVGGVGRSPIGVDDGVAGGGGSGESGGGQAAAEAAAAAGAASEGEGRADGDESGGGGGGGGGGATTEISSSRFFRPPAPIEIDERTRAAAATRTAAAAATTTAGQPFGRGCDISSSSSRDGGGGVLGRSVGTSDTIEDGMDLEIPPFRCTPSESGSPSHNLTGGRELVESAESLGALSPTLEMTEKEPPDISTGKVASPFSTNASETETPIRQLEKLVADVVKDGEELSKLYENIASDPAKKFSSNIVSLIVTAVVNGAKRVVEAASSIIDVSGLESLLQYIERGEQ